MCGRCRGWRTSFLMHHCPSTILHLHLHLHRVQRASQDGAGLPDQFVKPPLRCSLGRLRRGKRLMPPQCLPFRVWFCGFSPVCCSSQHPGTLRGFALVHPECMRQYSFIYLFIFVLLCVFVYNIIFLGGYCNSTTHNEALTQHVRVD